MIQTEVSLTQLFIPTGTNKTAAFKFRVFEVCLTQCMLFLAVIVLPRVGRAVFPLQRDSAVRSCFKVGLFYVKKKKKDL